MQAPEHAGTGLNVAADLSPQSPRHHWMKKVARSEQTTSSPDAAQLSDDIFGCLSRQPPQELCNLLLES